jgi:hypothetical protein
MNLKLKHPNFNLHTFDQGSAHFQKIWSNFQILNAKRAIFGEFHTEDPQFWSDVWTSLLSGFLCWVHVHQYAFLRVRKKNYSNYVENIRFHRTKCSRAAVAVHCAKEMHVIVNNLTSTVLNVLTDANMLHFNQAIYAFYPAILILFNFLDCIFWRSVFL